MAVKRYPPQDESNNKDIEANDGELPVKEDQPSVEEVQNLEMKIAANTKELNNISNALAQSILISTMMAANAPANSEIQEKINSSNEAIAACVEEAKEIGAVLNYIKKELKQFK